MRQEDLLSFNGLTIDGVIRRLHDLGYKAIGGGSSATVFAHPERPENVIRASRAIAESRAFADLCMEHPDNPYLPRVDAAHITTGPAPLFLTVMERLVNLRASDAPSRTPLLGMARAMALILEGDDAHNDAHGFMLQDKNLCAVIGHIARQIAGSIARDEDSYLSYDCGLDRKLPLDQQETDTILFREKAPGRWQPVFIDPFRAAPMGHGVARADKHGYAVAVLRRAGIKAGPDDHSSNPAATPRPRLH